jgi:uncharacterized membrane protein
MAGALLRYLPFAAGAVLVAVMVHILAVLTLPDVALRTAGSLLEARAGDTGLRLLPLAAPGVEATPFADPAMVTAVCGFDLADGPFRIRAQMGEWFTSLVVVSPRGAVMQGISDKAAIRRLLDVVLVTDQQLRALESQDPEDRPPQEIRLRVSVARGFVVLRSLAPRASDLPAVTDVVRRAQCAAMAEP